MLQSISNSDYDVSVTAFKITLLAELCDASQTEGIAFRNPLQEKVLEWSIKRVRQRAYRERTDEQNGLPTDT